MNGQACLRKNVRLIPFGCRAYVVTTSCALINQAMQRCGAW
ncbi:hypothetical protein EVA_18874 [gut metagenome]|uniref:Uncharacterized protein n=1 Tax=gut metagenome TaxID=749906 RepID=J9G0A5_9ZZZZ